MSTEQDDLRKAHEHSFGLSPTVIPSELHSRFVP